MNVTDIVKKYLDDNSYDGLAGDGCGCEKDDLFPCSESENCILCEPGYKVKCNPETCPADGSCEWHMSTEKEVMG